MATGSVKWFDTKKGYGFILVDENESDPESGSKEAFVHYAHITGEGYRSLEEGQRVEFSLTATPKGLAAVDVQLFDSQVNSQEA